MQSSTLIFATHGNLADRVRKHGAQYAVDLEAVIVERTDKGFWCDTSRPQWSEMVAKYRARNRTTDTACACNAGPGTELKRLLAGIGIKAAANCSCNARAHEMNRRGPDWCAANIDTIVGWLREEATRQGKPFAAAVARIIVRRAIRNSRKRRLLPPGTRG